MSVIVPVTKQSIVQMLRRLWYHISPRRRGQFGGVLLLMMIACFAEVFSIGAVLPFITALTAPDRIYSNPTAQPFIQALGFTAPSQLVLPLTVCFGVAALFAGVMRILLQLASTRLSFAAGADLSISIYRRTLYQPYSVHCARNSSEVIAGISVKANTVIVGIILPILNLLSASVLLLVILVALVSIDPVIALLAFGGLGSIYGIVIGLTRKQLLIDSQCIASESANVIKCLQEGLGGIRDVLIDGNQAAYCQIYRNADLRLRRAQASHVFISASPRYGMEALGMLLIASLAYSLVKQPDGIAKAIPILAAFAIGAQRLLPALQQVYSAWSNIQVCTASLRDALDLLDQPIPAYADKPKPTPISFNRVISLKRLGFRYNQNNVHALSEIDLNIPKGGRVGFIGTTGSGKTTLVDVIMGLIQPTEGTVEVDGQVLTPENLRSWQAHIAHVPQAIYLADKSIEENIAFGVPNNEIDHLRVREAAQQAQLAQAIESWPAGYQTLVGERGICLSGGQRQRIGIARALYKQANVIIFDEATSALDLETEQEVMQAIEGLSKSLTLLIIAHRLHTLRNCTQIVELKNAKIKSIGTYSDLVERKQT